MNRKDNQPEILVTADGPYVVTGSVPIVHMTIETNTERESVNWVEGVPFDTAGTSCLCRCGQSDDKPFCDGSHADALFDGTETASQRPYDARKHTFKGVRIILEDAPDLCSNSRFCNAPQSIWDAVQESAEPAIQEMIIRQAAMCPSGRLVVVDDATGKALEPEFPPSIGVTQDPGAHCSGPLWVRGGIPVRSDSGRTYEVRNRVTLCRCGESGNKPFCDGAHIEIGFQDGLG